MQEPLEAAQSSYNEGQKIKASLSARYDDIIPWEKMYDTASLEAKKMIVNCLIKWIEVYKNYKVYVEFNM